jgi:hypothetical protein
MAPVSSATKMFGNFPSYDSRGETGVRLCPNTGCAFQPSIDKLFKFIGKIVIDN